MHILILGANSDIAFETAKLFAEHDQATFSLASKDLATLKTKAQDLTIRYDVKTHAYPFDIMRFDTHDTFYHQLPTKPDLVLIAVGMLGNEQESFTHFDKALEVIQTNYTGIISILNIISHDFRQRQQGTIAVISSIAGLRGRSKNSLYGSAKSGITTYLSGLRQRLSKHNVTVLTILPGFIQTKMTAQITIAKPLLATKQQSAKDIYKAIKKKRNIVYTPWFWRWIMIIVHYIPETLFKKMSF